MTENEGDEYRRVLGEQYVRATVRKGAWVSLATTLLIFFMILLLSGGASKLSLWPLGVFCGIPLIGALVLAYEIGLAFSVGIGGRATGRDWRAALILTALGIAPLMVGSVCSILVIRLMGWKAP